MINSNAFNYINVLDKAADASWLRNEAIANNLANADTPGYKREDITFEKELKRALKYNDYETMDAKVSHLSSDRLKPRTYKDYMGYEYRLDGNNVDPETENVLLAKNQLMYEGLINSINQEFSNLQLAIKSK
ncbi:MAG: flagellar basal body rod protein FlgB [Lachnospiraceae bacterium]|nr:flagellar basal body rod protein FlgB [Lachnospiraceae bacterium]